MCQSGDIALRDLVINPLGGLRNIYFVIRQGEIQMKQDPKDVQSENKQDNRWLFGILIGIGIAVALSVALDSLILGLPIGIGAGFVFAAGLYRQSKQ